MKLAFFVADYPVTSETFILRQIAGLVRRGHDVTVITGYVNDKIPDPLDGQITVRCIRKSSRLSDHLKMATNALLNFAHPRRWSCLAVAINALNAKIFGVVLDIYFLKGNELGKYDAIVAHFGPVGVRAMLLRDAGLLSGPIATVFHGIDMTDRITLGKYGILYKELFVKTEALLPISELWREKLLGWGAVPKKLQVLRMGVDIETANEDKIHEPVRDPLRILSVGRFVEKKGLEYAIRGVTESGVGYEYTIVGYGPLENHLKSVAAETGSHRIKFAGKIGHAEVFDLLSQSDIFLLPSVTASNGDMEGIPVSIMEAMAAGVLVVSTQHSGIPELVENNVEGFLVKERDSDEIGKVLSDISQGRVDVVKMKSAARKKVVSDFDNKILDKELESILARLKLA